MKHITPVFLFIVTVALGILACSKEAAYRTNDIQNTTTAANKVQSARVVTSTCAQFAYPDTIFYLTNLPGGNYIVKPVNPLTGTFGAYPDGLKIDKSDGSINITGSETGLKYMVWFVASGTRDTCRKFITVSGINYMDSTYVLANNTATAIPIYNANPLKPTDCSGGCEFDVGPPAERVSAQGIVINRKTGVINLKKSLLNGALGKNPANGTYKDFILEYRLGDKSSKALNHIGFRLYYYKKKSDIPANLENELEDKKGQVFLGDDSGEEEDDRGGGGHGGSGGGHSGPGGGGSDDNRIAFTFTASAASTTAKQGAATAKCRPPYIIVTQQ
ncbi:hypothetical protein FC093_02410 [Ilyomonas limi]|uniref:Lipoprotein n=1 Tax=Ilyomonas limi TaxID=2575867 RepID=A0A4U3L9T3_9BACT|nr:hypothetical protein [Ilyomonas limi]TKK71890.1 hypothetical protein FC093_02410 [Ilyomonas limi]